MGSEAFHRLMPTSECHCRSALGTDLSPLLGCRTQDPRGQAQPHLVADSAILPSGFRPVWFSVWLLSPGLRRRPPDPTFTWPSEVKGYCLQDASFQIQIQTTGTTASQRSIFPSQSSAERASHGIPRRLIWGTAEFHSVVKA